MHVVRVQQAVGEDGACQVHRTKSVGSTTEVGRLVVGIISFAWGGLQTISTSLNALAMLSEQVNLVTLGTSGLLFGLAFLPLMLGRAILPGLAACKTVVALRAAYFRSAAITALLAGGLSILLAVAAPLFLSLYGSGFAGAQAPYLVLVVAQGLFFFTHLNYMLIFARGRMRTGWALTLVALAVNLTANFLLIPPMGPSGAALAMVLSEATLLAAQVPIIRSLIGSSSPASTAVAGDQESAARAA